jgi:hypothetical protein
MGWDRVTIFPALTGQEEQPQLAVVLSTLVIAVLFNAQLRSTCRPGPEVER